MIPHTIFDIQVLSSLGCLEISVRYTNISIKPCKQRYETNIFDILEMPYFKHMLNLSFCIQCLL